MAEALQYADLWKVEGGKKREYECSAGCASVCDVVRVPGHNKRQQHTELTPQRTRALTLSEPTTALQQTAEQAN